MVKTYPCLCFVGQRNRPGNEHNKAQCLPISRDSDITSSSTTGPGRTKIWLIDFEGYHTIDKNEVPRALPLYKLHQ